MSTSDNALRLGVAMYDYDQDFFELMNRDAIRSAGPILEQVSRWLSVRSVVDFGCGQGAWLSVWKQQYGCSVLGIDGAASAQARLLVAADEFKALDLTAPIELGERFDLVQSLEVAEHLPRRAARDFVATLTCHGDFVLFSAAPPGQGGEYHINERPYTYWRKLFAERDYVLVDAVRPSVRDHAEVSYWYRFNTFLYVKHSALPRLPKDIQRQVLPMGQAIPDFAPMGMKLARWLTRPMPTWYVTFIARRIIKPHVVRQYRAALHQGLDNHG